ncbi:hypothetical protein [Nonomuraea sp. SYSU D8015]|uniref:hypothetical protein n=1 Tax=Nonomuraea sp. SYSU D8015 TaxID=2593644 RepID=UPI001661673A|nr:hypothetical protein [Nonomuraea sp. SYSU D8015]
MKTLGTLALAGAAMTVLMIGAFNLKAGPYAGRKCPIVRKLARGTQLYFHCWVRNSRGNLWVFARVKGTGTHGWMSIDNLNYRHTNFRRCPSSV